MNNIRKNHLTLTDSEYKTLSEIIFRTSGINFGESKKNLLKTRLDPLLTKLGLNSYTSYIYILMSKNPDDLIEEMINELSFGHTFFFRYKKQFDFFMKYALQKVKADKIQANNHEINVWCTASSTGEEAYTIAICLLEKLGFNNDWTINLLATDVSTKSIETAKSANYHLDQIQNVDPKIIDKYFDFKKEGGNEFYSVKEIVKCFVSFKIINLITDQLTFEKKFDFIFCRNVMIYFDQKNQQELELKLINNLDNKGCLFLGDSESLSIANSCRMKHLEQSTYKKL